MTLEVRLQDVEPGPRYRLTFRRPPVLGSRRRVLEGVLKASFWGEVPLETEEGLIRIQRQDVVRAAVVY